MRTLHQENRKKLNGNDIDTLLDISNTGGYVSVDLSKYENGKIKLEVIDEKCKGVGFEAYWE